jgi:hypothetical protein
LSIRFTRLFKLSIDKNILVAEMCRWGWGDEGGGWRWRRCLLVWEEELVMECGAMLENMLYINVPNQWMWQLDPDVILSLESL